MDFDGTVEHKSVNYIFSTTGTILDLDFDLDDSTESPFDEEPFEDACVGSDYRVVHIVENARFVGVHDEPTVVDSSCMNPVVFRLSEDTGQMMDTGANCCITNNLSCLVDIESIPPFAVGVAVSGETVTPSLCTKRGFIPLPLPNGDHYFQRVYYNENATDTIMSPLRPLSKIAAVAW